jgi:hypothetical protein
MRSKQSISKAIHRERRAIKGFPLKPTVFEDLVDLPPQLKVTSDGQPFIILNDTVIVDDPTPNAKRLLLFMSPHGREVLSGCSSWYVDGTFKAASNTLFSQIVFVVGLTDLGKAVPCLFGLLPNKDKETYLRLAGCLKQEMDTLPEVKVKSIMMDYEKGLITAFKTAFPSVALVGCEFHWKNCLRKRIATDGLMVLYNSDLKLQQLIRTIWALAFVPLDMVTTVWETIIQEKLRVGCLDWEEDYGPEMASFVKYVDSTWIGELNHRTKLRKRPSYPHEMWNKFEATLNGDHKTNNLVEGYNNGFKLSLPPKASDWTVIDRFRTEESLSKLSLQQAALGSDPDQRRSRVLQRQDREDQLRTLVSNFNSMSVSSYLDSLVTFFD